MSETPSEPETRPTAEAGRDAPPADGRAAEHRRLRRRYRRDRRFKAYTIASLVVAGLFLAFFLVDLVLKGYTGLWQTELRTTITYNERTVDRPERAVPEGMEALVSQARLRQIPREGKMTQLRIPVRFSEQAKQEPTEALRTFTLGPDEFFLPQHRDRAPYTVTREQVRKLVGEPGLEQIRQRLTQHPELLGRTEPLWLWASPQVDQFLEFGTGLSDELRGVADLLQQAGRTQQVYDVARFGPDGRGIEQWVLADAEVDQYVKGNYSPIRLGAEQYERLMEAVGREPTAAPDREAVLAEARALRERQQAAGDLEPISVPSYARFGELVEAWLDRQRIEQLIADGDIRQVFNHYFFLNGDSGHPEAAGIAPAVVGSVMVLGLIFVLVMPVGVLTSIYLEEFAPDNWLTQTIEVNINNLAAIPSILFGVLGLAAFINWFGMPRSSALVGGATLALMTLPIVIISSRAALRAVPDSIRMAGHAMGASRWQVVVHHVLPQSVSGILTGSIIGLAQAMGETAPLIIVGLIAFAPDIATGVTETTTVMPAQIFSWWGDAQRPFQERAALAILCLLVVLFVMNGLALIIRARSEKTW
jgi:phosphate transport system permease protein